MPNTSKTAPYSLGQGKEEELISSLKVQPLIVVLRSEQKDFNSPFLDIPFYSLMEQLQYAGVKHVEIAFSTHPNWMSLIKGLTTSFTSIRFGAASITNFEALAVVAKLKLDYAMTPVWNPTLQTQAKKLNQLLIPGVFSPSEIQQAKSFGCKLIKLFPATTLGIKYLHHLTGPIGSLPFVIAAGGLTVEDLDPWLKEGYGAIALGRKLVKNHQIDPLLQQWIQTQKGQ